MIYIEKIYRLKHVKQEISNLKRRSMEAIDKKTLIHAGIETVVIAGITFYFNKRISTLEDYISQMNEKLNKYEEIIQRQDQVISIHDQALRDMMARFPSPGHSNSPQTQARPQKKPQERSTSIRRPQRQAPISNTTEQDLDDILNSELSKLDETSEVMCTDEECEIIMESSNDPENSRIKKKRRRKVKKT